MWAWIAALLLAVAAGPAAAQNESPPPATPAAPQAPGGGGGGGAVTLEQDTSGLYFEWGLTAVGAGIAVYTVCRSSRRN